ncbi:tetratricopeptide repeat-containing sensor histidine kinase [Pedobacter immunditicola]|uniref:tetratricopeptide repeat-containing sensor histidine kinase n=1 Tax=Pedobacter immunditicola TaxID=3133440 RepID=UPI0030AFEC8C
MKQEKQLSKELLKEKYDKANDFFDGNRYDSAFYYYNKVVSSSPDSLLVGKSLFNMAITQSVQGDYFGSDESAVKSLNYFNQTHTSYLGAVYNTIAINKTNLKAYPEAVIWYKKSIAITSDYKDSLMFQNNLAVVHFRLKEYNTAKDIFKQLLENDTVKSNPNLLAKAIDNFTYTKWLENPNYEAAPGLLKALTIRKKGNDLWGQNASFSHLADYYSKNNPDSALIYAHKMYQMANQLNSADDRLEALQKLIKLSTAETTKRYFEIYQQLGDSVQTAQNAAKNQFAIIRYETEKHQADNLKLQKDNTEKTYQLMIVLISTILLFIAGVFWYKKRKQKLALEAQHAIKESQLKTSKRVHDVVANGLYRVMTEIENQEHIHKEHVLDRIEDLYEKSRDISYETQEPSAAQFHEKISELLTSFATESTKMLIAGNAPELWDSVNAKVQYEIKHILQELMVNMKKHSGASNVGVRFEQKFNHIYIYYTDNGIGMKESTKRNNGLRNTGNRIDTIKGAITFDTKVEKGLKIQISFPLA